MLRSFSEVRRDMCYRTPHSSTYVHAKYDNGISEQLM